VREVFRPRRRERPLAGDRAVIYTLTFSTTRLAELLERVGFDVIAPPGYVRLVSDLEQGSIAVEVAESPTGPWRPAERIVDRVRPSTTYL
jgi:hypothetical protein